MVELVGARVVLRPWREGDEEALARLANDRAVSRHLMDRFPHPYRRADAETWIRLNLAKSGLPTQFAITVAAPAAGGAAGGSGPPVGGIGFERLEDIYRLTGRAGYWLGKEYWGKGYATEALQLVTAYAFERFDFERLEAEVLEGNPASRRVLEKAGYQLEGVQRRRVVKDGVVMDGWLYATWRPAPG